MKTKMIALIGEQPIPNLLPILCDLPTEVLFVRTDLTRESSLRLEKVLQGKTAVSFLEISDAYNISQIYECLASKIEQLGWLSEEIIFNVTGGTKPMSIAAYQLAANQSCPALYLQSEGRQTRLRQYNFSQGRADLTRDEIIPSLITIADYLLAHLPGFRSEGFHKDAHGNLTVGGQFEKQIYKTLEPQVGEIMAGVRPEGVRDQIEIDLVVRCGNQVGIIEAKTGTRKEGIDQLSTAGGRAYLGIYTAKFLIMGNYLSSDLKTLAQARDISVIELPQYREGKALAATEANRLIQTIRQKLGADKKVVNNPPQPRPPADRRAAAAD